MLRNLTRVNVLGSLSSLAVASCCILPMALMLMGMGGSWLAVFGRIAAVSYAVAGVSTALLVAGWVMVYRRGSPRSLRLWLGMTTALTGMAWLVILNESRINDFLLQNMM